MGTLIIVNGDDDFLKERAVYEELEISLSKEIHHFRFPDDIDKYKEFLDFESNLKSTVVIWNANEIPQTVDNGTTIAVSVNGKNLVDKSAKRTVDIHKLKPYNNGLDYIKWILKEGDRLNIDLSRIASALFVNCGTDLRKISSEIRKIKVLSDSDGAIDPSVAREVMCFSADLTPKCILDAICEGNPAKAIAFYDKLQESGDETGWIIAYLQRHILTQFRSGTMLALGMPLEKISESVGLKLQHFKISVLPNLNLWSLDSVRQSLSTLCELEILHKRGIDVCHWGLEPEIIRLSEEAKQNVASRRS